MQHLIHNNGPVSKAAAYTVTAEESGQVFIATAVDIVFTLPAAQAGLTYTFVAGVASASTGLSLNPASGEAINGGTANKDWINTPATDAIGDSVTVASDGTDWWTTAMHGIWAEEA